MKKIMIFPITALVAFTLACADKKPSDPLRSGEEIAATENQVALNAAQVGAIGLQTGKISQQPITDVVNASGYVDVPPSGKAVVSPLVPGVRASNQISGGQ